MRRGLLDVHALVPKFNHDAVHRVGEKLMPFRPARIVIKTGLRQAGCGSSWLESSAYDWMIRVAIVLVFTLIVLGNVNGAIQVAVNWKHQTLDHTLLNMAARVSSALFMALAAVTTLTRLPPIRKAAGIEPRMSALLGTFLLTALATLPRAEFAPISLAISSVLVIAGMAASFVVLRWLGKAFSIMAEARQLITRGPYAYVRHPLYICEEAAVIGIFMQVISPVALIILIAHAFFQFRRMLNEERILKATFAEYESYAERTPRLIPRSWVGWIPTSTPAEVTR
jgi:protein-S-isoprenylcysteine O-methyltransferase Ste14